MWRWIVNRWNQFRARQRLRKEVSPANLRTLTGEIKDIAYLSSRLWARDQGLQERVRKICQEMDQLDRLLDQSAFKRLPENKKRELRSSLIVSRDELLKNLRSAPCPTDRIQ